MCSIN